MTISPYVIPGLPTEMRGKSAEKIKEAVCSVTGYSWQQLTKKGRERNKTVARAIAYYFLRTETNLTLSAIGRVFNQDHTTVIHGLSTLQDLLDTENETAVRYYTETKKRIGK